MGVIILIIMFSIIGGIVKRVKRGNARRAARRARENRAWAASIRAQQTAAAARQREAARLEREQAKRRAEELKRAQAAADLDYIEQARQTVLKLYGAAEAEYNSATTDRKRETALNRMLKYDAKMRKLDKDRERAAMIAA